MEAPVARCTQNVSQLPSWLPRGWTFQSWKTLRQIFPIFVSRVLATWSGDLFVTYFSHENCVFCDLRIVKKKKKFSLVHFDCSLSCPFISLTNSPRFSQRSTIFIIISSSNFKKRYGFSIFLKVFHIYSLCFLVFEMLLRFEKCDVRKWVGFILLSLLNGFCWYW